MDTQIVLMIVTAASIKEAEQIGQALVEKKLIACCNIISPVSSIFHWKGEICHEQEVMMLLKTVRENISTLVREIKKLHSYETPEIIALPIIAGAADYLDWVKTETKTG